MSVLCRTDVTAVKIFNNFVFVGIGSYINVFDLVTTKLLHRSNVLKGQKIYGIICCEISSNVLIFGGKQFTLISIDDNHLTGCVSISSVLDTVICDDWLHAAVWTSNDAVALLTAHNVVHVWGATKGKMLSNCFSSDNSILYSGLVVSLEDDILVFAGTVFSKVIIHRCKEERPLHYLEGHKGVIFSIIYDASTQTIVTTSDDRSVRVWQPNNQINCPPSTTEYWNKIQIVCQHVLYGHLARVMKCNITPDYIISGGEDATICFWDKSGQLLRRKVSHQSGCIWSIDSNDTHLLSGGGDGGVQMHLLRSVSENGQHDVLEMQNNLGNPKKIAFTARGNIVTLCENDLLLYYDCENKVWQNMGHLEHTSTYKLMGLSSCKQIVAVVDRFGKLNVLVENCKLNSLQHLLSTKLEIGKILSLYWASNRHLVLYCENGKIHVLTAKNTDIETYSIFILPPNKERRLTAAAIDSSKELLVVGDRCGDIFFYRKGQSHEAIRIFRKVHGRFGPTSLSFNNADELISTGRDGTIKYFITNDMRYEYLYKYMNKICMDFDWVEKFLDKNQTIVCGFQERVFVLYDIKKCERVLEVPCGGGHRSWDAIRYFEKINGNYEEFVKLIYLKNSNIHTHIFQLNKMVSRTIINGTHSKEINCLLIHKSGLINFLIAGGEDTSLRISYTKIGTGEASFKDMLIFKHLSSIRAIKIYQLRDDEIILVSGGGRGQICIRTLQFNNVDGETRIKVEDVVDYLIKGSDKDRKGKNWRDHRLDLDAEMRIMSLEIVYKEDENVFIIVVACSDAVLRLFKFTYDYALGSKFVAIGEVKYHKSCILKTHIVKMNFFEQVIILITMTTTGQVAFWNLNHILDLVSMKCNETEMKPFFVTNTNKAGINSYAFNIINTNEILLATGGDDNAIHVILLYIKELEFRNDLTCVVAQRWQTDRWHCAQVTGLKFVGKYLISTSIDQRITLSEFKHFGYQFLSQSYSDVSDIQGLELVETTSESIRVCVFGKGFEVLDLAIPKCNI